MSLRSSTVNSRDPEVWDKSKLFRDWAHWEETLGALPSRSKLTRVRNKYRGNLRRSVRVLREFLDFYFELDKSLDCLKLYVTLCGMEDITCQICKNNVAKLGVYVDGVRELLAFAEQEMLQYSGQIKRFLKDSALAPYAAYIRGVFQDKAHTISAEEDDVVVRLSLASDLENIWNLWYNTEYLGIKCDVPGEDVTVNDVLDSKIPMAHDTFVEWRRCSYKAVERASNIIGNVFVAFIMQKQEMASIHRHESILQMELHSLRVGHCVYDKFVKAIDRYTPFARNFLDIYATLTGRTANQAVRSSIRRAINTCVTFTWDEACSLVVDSCRCFGADYQKRMADAMSTCVLRKSGSCVDETSQCKVGVGEHNYIKLSWGGSLEDVLTLTHEVGHVMHDSSSAWQPYSDTVNPPPTSEIHSQLHELLLRQHMLTVHSGDPIMTGNILLGRIVDVDQSIFSQMMFNKFELGIDMALERDEVLSVELLDRIFVDADRAMFGWTQAEADVSKRYWILVSHFWSGFYVWLYSWHHVIATSIICGMNDGSLSPQDVLNFISAPYSTPNDKLFGLIGIDLNSQAYIRKAFATYKTWIQQSKKSILTKSYKAYIRNELKV